MVHALGGRLTHEQPVRIVLCKTFFERLETFNITKRRNLSSVHQRVALALAPTDRFLLGAGHQQVEPRAIRELQHLPVRSNDAERFAKVPLRERSDVALDDAAINLTILLGVSDKTANQVSVNRQPEDIDRQRNGGYAELS